MPCQGFKPEEIQRIAVKWIRRFWGGTGVLRPDTRWSDLGMDEIRRFNAFAAIVEELARGGLIT